MADTAKPPITTLDLHRAIHDIGSEVLPFGAKVILWAMLRDWDPYTNCCFPSVRGLAHDLGINKDTVTEYLSLALKGGWIVRTPLHHKVACGPGASVFSYSYNLRKILAAVPKVEPNVNGHTRYRVIDRKTLSDRALRYLESENGAPLATVNEQGGLINKAASEPSRGEGKADGTSNAPRSDDGDLARLRDLIQTSRIVPELPSS